MTDKEKDQAIFKALCGLADKYLNMAKDTDAMRKATEKKPMLTYKDITKSERYEWSLWETILDEMFKETPEPECIVVGNFRCSFNVADIFDIMKCFGNASKYTFTLQQEETRTLVAKFTMMFGKGAKRIADFTLPKSDMTHPVFQNVVVEYDTVTAAVNVIGCDMKSLAVITDDDDSLVQSRNKQLVAMVPAAEWKRICTETGKSKCPMEFAFYAKTDSEAFDTLVISSGDVIVKSIQPEEHHWPNWRIVLPSLNDMHYYRIAEKDRKMAQKWLSKVKKTFDGAFISVSVYEGSNRIYFDSIQESTWGKQDRTSVSFELTAVSDRTIGVAFDPDHVKRFKPEGFWLQDQYKGAYCIDEDFDRLLVMPKMVDDATFDVEERTMAVAVA